VLGGRVIGESWSYNFPEALIFPSLDLDFPLKPTTYDLTPRYRASAIALWLDDRWVLRPATRAERKLYEQS
jgi:hypothetical protein